MSRARSPKSSRVRTTQHIRRRGTACTRLPGRDVPEGTRRSRDGSHSPAPPVLTAEPHGRSRTAASSTHQVACWPRRERRCRAKHRSGDLPAALASRRCFHRRSTRTKEVPSRQRSATSLRALLRSKRFRLVSYRLDTPTSLAVARRRRRLFSDGALPTFVHESKEPDPAGLGRSFPQRLRRGSIPADPARQEARVPLGSR